MYIVHIDFLVRKVHQSLANIALYTSKRDLKPNPPSSLGLQISYHDIQCLLLPSSLEFHRNLANNHQNIKVYPSKLVFALNFLRDIGKMTFPLPCRTNRTTKIRQWKLSPNKTSAILNSMNYRMASFAIHIEANLLFINHLP